VISLLVVDPSKNFVGQIKNITKRDKKIKNIASVDDPSDIEGVLQKHGPAVLIFGPNCDEEDVLSTAKDMADVFPYVGALLLTKEATTELLQRAMRAGIKDVLSVPVKEKEFGEAIERVYEVSEKLFLSMNAQDKPTTKTQAASIDSKIITFFSTKGGTGKTFIATNLAISLLQQTKKKVVLVDFDLEFGDIAVMLQLFPQYTINDAVSVIERLDGGMLKSFLTKHSSGLDVLIAPLEPDLADLISSEDIRKILDMLQQEYDYIVVDSPPSFNDKVLGVLDRTDQICLIATMDVPSIKNTKLSLQTMNLLSYPPGKVTLVLNRSDSKVGLHTGEIEKSLNMKVAATIPSSRIVPLSINKGDPLILDSSRSPVAMGIKQLTELILKKLEEKSKLLNKDKKYSVKSDQENNRGRRKNVAS